MPLTPNLFMKKILVQLANKDEKFTTLDGTELSLTGEELMIKDAERSLCLAGIVGGKTLGFPWTPQISSRGRVLCSTINQKIISQSTDSILIRAILSRVWTQAIL